MAQSTVWMEARIKKKKNPRSTTAQTCQVGPRHCNSPPWQFSNMRWKLFHGIGLCENSVWENSRGSPLSLNQLKTRTKSTNFFCSPYRRERRGCVRAADGGWSQQVALSSICTRAAVGGSFSGPFVLQKPRLLRPEGFNKLVQSAGERMPTRAHSKHARFLAERGELGRHLRNMVMYCWPWRFQ